MRIVLHAESDLTLTDLEAPGFDVESEAEDVHYSALQMFATSLALCTASVLAAYGENLEVSIEGLAVRVRWDYVDKPYRVGQIAMDITWPGVPESRLKAAERAAATCTIHNTLHHPPEIETRVTRGDAAPADADP